MNATSYIDFDYLYINYLYIFTYIADIDYLYILHYTYDSRKIP